MRFAMERVRTAFPFAAEFVRSLLRQLKRLGARWYGHVCAAIAQRTPRTLRLGRL